MRTTKMLCVCWLHGFVGDDTEKTVSAVFDVLWDIGKFGVITEMEATEENIKKAYNSLNSFSNVLSGNYGEIYFIDIFTCDEDGDFVENEDFIMSNDLYNDNGDLV